MFDGNQFSGNPTQWTPEANNFAKLFVFSRRTISDTTVRPYNYVNSTDFVDVAGKAVESSLVYDGNDRRTLAGLYLDTPQMAHLVKPVANGFTFDGRQMSDNWTFLLYIDNAPLRNRVSTHSSTNRYIYSGFIIGEPYIKSFTSLRNVENPEAVYYITSVVRVTIKNTHAPNGGNIITSRPDLITDVIHHDFVTSASNGRYILGRPSDLMPNTSLSMYEDNPRMDHSSSIGTDLSLDRGNTTSVQSSFSNARCHGSTILSAIVKTATDEDNSKVLSGNMLDVHNSVLVDRRDLFCNNLQRQVADFSGLDTSRPILYHELLSYYPSLGMSENFVVFPNIQQHMFTDTNGAAPTPINVATTLVQQSITPIIKECGLSDLSFRYTTAIPTMQHDTASMGYNDQLPYAVETLKAPGSLMSSDNIDIINRKACACIEAIRRQVFSIIQEIYGDFDIIIHYSAGNDCSIHIQLPEHSSSINNDVLVWNDMLTSMLNPTVIDTYTAANNNDFLETAWNLSPTFSNNIKHQNSYNNELFNIAPNYNNGYNQQFPY